MVLWFGLALTLVFVAGFSTYVSIVVRRGAFEPTRRVPPFDVEVVRVTEGAITLRPAGRLAAPARWNQPGIWGLRWEHGHGRLGRILASVDGETTREWTAFEGSLGPGDRTRVDPTAWPLDPKIAFGLQFMPVAYTSSAGKFTGWVWGPDRATWVLLLHGKRAARPRMPPYSYPVLPVAAAAGCACFQVSYRNDVGAPEGDGLHWYGLREWEDLESAVRYAMAQGAQRFVLVGYSMGGAIAMSFLYRSELARRVVGLILDAPVLDLREVIDFGIGNRGVPHTLISPGLWLTRVRLGFHWSELDYLKGASTLSTPILLFHGDRDRTVPIRTSDRLAKLRPDLLTYVRVEGAAHAQSWNVDPPAYERAVRTFLSGLV